MSDKVSNKIFCGATKLPKGKTYGSMKECAEQSQIRRFGLFKADENIVNTVSKKKIKADAEAKQKEKEKNMISLIGMLGKIKNLERQLSNAKDATKKAALEKEIKQLIAKQKKLREEINKLESKR
jgi:hypothetical protein